MLKPSHRIKFVASGRGKPQCPPNPAFPEGIDLDLEPHRAVMRCGVRLPYPAAECGVWFITCDTCGYVAAVTAAGRPDDPRSVTIPCKVQL